MAMRLADTFLVYLRSCFAILFSGQTPRWSLPRFLDTAARLQRSMRRLFSWDTVARPPLLENHLLDLKRKTQTKIEHIAIEQMFANIAFTSCKCEHAR